MAAIIVNGAAIRRIFIACVITITLFVIIFNMRRPSVSSASEFDIPLTSDFDRLKFDLPKLPAQRNRFRIWPPDLRYAICKPKIFVYPIPASIQISDKFMEQCGHSNYNSELILYKELMDPSSATHKLYVTNEPSEAEIFFVPLFGACYLYNCWVGAGWKDLSKRCDVDETYVKPLMDHIESSQFMNSKTGVSYWQRNGGKDHFMFHPMDHTDTYYANSRDRLRNATYLTTVGDKRSVMAGQWRRYKDIVIPSATPILNDAKVYPPDYIPYTTTNVFSASGIVEEGNPYDRDIFVLFRGLGEAYTPEDDYGEGVRSLFFGDLKKRNPNWDIDARSSYSDYAKKLGRARFGLAPAGWTLDTTRIWEYLAFGVVPVVLADGIVEPFEDDVDWDAMIVRVRRSEAHRLPQILGRITDEEYQEKRRRVWNVGRHIVLGGHTWHYIIRSLCRINEIIRPEEVAIDGYTYHEL